MTYTAYVGWRYEDCEAVEVEEEVDVDAPDARQARAAAAALLARDYRPGWVIVRVMPADLVHVLSFAVES